MRKITFYITAITLFIFSCKKNKHLPEPQEDEPEFYVNCNIQGQPLKMEAGNNDYYMNSSWYRVDTSEIYVYQGLMKKQNGQDYEITILFNTARALSVNPVMKVDCTLTLGRHLYNDQEIKALTQSVVFKPIKSLTPSASYSWFLTDGVSQQNYSGTANETYSVSPVLELGKTYSVSLSYDDGMGVCNRSHTNVFKVGSDLQTNIEVVRKSQGELRYEFSYSLPQINGAFACQWKFEADNTYATSPVVTKTFQEGTSLVKLKLTNKTTGDSCISYYQLNATNRPVCEANFKAQFLPLQNTKIYSSVVVLLKDPNGAVYSSQNVLQPSSSSFELLSISEYKQNENLQATKRLKLKFSCVVKNGSSELNITDGDAVIAVAYK